MKKITSLLIVCLFAAASAQSQENIPFWSEVQALKKKDSLSFPAPNQVLLIGSSSFTMWQDVQEYFPRHKILNRAFGGSTLLDLIRFRYEVIYPYHPRQIVMYCGENDFASSDTVTVGMVLQRFKTLYRLIRVKHPSVPFLYVSMKPSPSRAHLMPRYAEANRLIKEFLATEAKTSFADVYSQMLKPDGSPIDDIFFTDKLHMNAKGYAIWQKILERYLIK